jgi:hypothetical protein
LDGQPTSHAIIGGIRYEEEGTIHSVAIIQKIYGSPLQKAWRKKNNGHSARRSTILLHGHQAFWRDYIRNE